MPIPINIATASDIKPYAQFGMSISGSIGLNICNCSIKEFIGMAFIDLGLFGMIVCL